MAKKDSDDAQDEGREHPGVPDSQWEAEHPSGEVTEQEAREMKARMPVMAEDAAASDEMAATDADPSDEAADAPAEG